jgi:glycopeptide antibiotics resistance protein
MISLKNGHSYFPEYLINGFVVIVLAIVTTLIITFGNKRRSWPLGRKLLFLLLSIYLASTISLTLFPINVFIPSNSIHLTRFGQQTMINLSPTTWINYGLTQSIGNFVLLMPLGFLLPILFKKMRSVGKITLAGFSFSFAIETIQLVLNYFYLGNRLFDCSDLLLNTAGCLLGWLIFSYFSRHFSSEIKYFEL